MHNQTSGAIFRRAIPVYRQGEGGTAVTQFERGLCVSCIKQKSKYCIDTQGGTATSCDLPGAFC